MKTLNYSLLLITLLTSCTGCKKPDTPDAPKDLIAETYGNCRIATQTVKQLIDSRNQSQWDIETINIGGESLKVSTTQKSAYSYDNQGRIIAEYNQYADGRADSAYYQYTSGAVHIRKVNLKATPKASTQQQIAVNNQGFAEYNSNLDQYATYDQQGYRLTLKSGGVGSNYTLKDGNLVETSTDFGDLGTIILKDEYDLTKSGLPTIIFFYGKESRNLIMSSSIDQKWGEGPVTPKIYLTTYTYNFDSQDRVVRQIIRGKKQSGGFFPYAVDKLTVKDFTYACR